MGNLPDLELVQLSAEDVRRALIEETKRYQQHRPWQTWEDDILREFHRKLPYHVLAEKLGRTIPMISHRLENIGLTKKAGSTPRRIIRKNSSRNNRRQRKLPSKFRPLRRKGMRVNE